MLHAVQLFCQRLFHITACSCIVPLYKLPNGIQASPLMAVLYTPSLTSTSRNGPGPEVEGTWAGDLRQKPVLPQEKDSKSAEEKCKASDLYSALLQSLVLLHSIVLHDAFSLFLILRRKSLIVATSHTLFRGHQLFLVAQNSSDPKLCAQKEEKQHSLL